MKTIGFIFLFLALTNFSWSQQELVNSYNYYSEVYGGMEDGGISRTESFAFVASTTIEIKEIFYQGQKIYLNKGDSLIVNVGKYTPYNNDYVTLVDSNQVVKEEPEIKMENRYVVLKMGNTYYVNVQYPYVWKGEIVYVCKKNLRVAKIKEGFDKGNTGYAP